MSEDLQKFVTNSIKSVYETLEGKLDFKMMDTIITNLLSKDSLIQEKNNLGYALIDQIKNINSELKISENQRKKFLEKPQTFDPITIDEKTIRLIKDNKLIMEQINTLVGDSIIKSEIINSLLQKSRIDSQKNKELIETIEALSKQKIEDKKIEDIQLFKSRMLELEEKDLDELNEEIENEKKPLVNEQEGFEIITKEE